MLTCRRGGAQSSAMSQLQMMLMQQRTGNKLPPLPFLVTNMIKHAGVSQFPALHPQFVVLLTLAFYR